MSGAEPEIAACTDRPLRSVWNSLGTSMPSEPACRPTIDAGTALGALPPLRVLMVTSEWTSGDNSNQTPFIGRQYEFLVRAGVGVDVVSFRGSKNPLNYIRGWFRCQARMRTGKYDLVHAQFGQSGILALPSSCPLVLTLRGSDLQGIVDGNGSVTLLGHVLIAVTRWASRRADAVVLVSRHMRQYLPKCRRVEIIPSGLDLELWNPTDPVSARRSLGWAAEDKVVLFVGNPEERRKNVALARRTIQILEKVRAVRLQIVWNVPHDQVPLMMSAADALLFTSRQEGSPNAVKEALACNLPVVSVPIADVPERCANVSTCVVTSGWDAGELAAGLNRVLDLPRSNEGRKSVQSLEEGLLTQKLISLYRSVAEGQQELRKL